MSILMMPGWSGFIPMQYSNKARRRKWEKAGMTGMISCRHFNRKSWNKILDGDF